MLAEAPISCINCGYPIADLPPGARCPECGHACADTIATLDQFTRTFPRPRLTSNLFIALAVFEVLAAAWLALPAMEVVASRIFQTNLFWAPGLEPRILSALIVGCIINAGVQAAWTVIAESVRLLSSHLRRVAVPAASIPGVMLCIWTAWTVLFDELSLIALPAFLLPAFLLFIQSFVIAPIAQTLFITRLTDSLPFTARAPVRSWNRASIVFALTTVIVVCFLALLMSFLLLPPAAVVIFLPLAPAAGSIRSWLLSRRIRAAITGH